MTRYHHRFTRRFLAAMGLCLPLACQHPRSAQSPEPAIEPAHEVVGGQPVREPANAPAVLVPETAQPVPPFDPETYGKDPCVACGRG